MGRCIFVLLLMSFYCPFAVMDAISMCRGGQWRADLVCTPCPIGMQCVDGIVPEPCPRGAVSVAPGAERCCNRNITCPVGTAVSPDSCACAPFLCALVRVGRELHCADAVVDGDTPCAKCGQGHAIETGCACARVNDCRGGAWWRTAVNRFACLLLR